MYTFQELEKLGENERERMEFVRGAVNAHKNSEECQIARDAEEYYARRNVTISRYQKFLRDVMGRKVPDYFGANYKLKTGMFRRFVIQQVQYVLSNGVTFEKDETKEKLGGQFDNKIQLAAKKALVDGVSFGFWNYDHLEVFGLADTPRTPGFVPIWCEETGALMAGIRYWSIGERANYTLYETDGYTDYEQKKGDDMRAKAEKRAYISTVKKTRAGDVEEEAGRNYPGFPIIPMYANDLQQSELVGNREAIDCYDLIKSGFANNIDEAQEIFWLIKNAGGMDDVDLTQFLERMRVVKGANLPDGVEADAHTLSIPTEAREKMLALLKKDLYDDFQIVNVSELGAGNKTATEIRAAYQPMDDKCGDFEYCIRDFIDRLLQLIGVEDEPSFQWNRIANQTEETNMVLAAAEYLDEETLLKKLPWLTPEEREEVMKKKSGEELEKFNSGVKVNA